MIIVLGSEKLSLVEMEAFLSASESVGFAGGSRAAVYRWSESLLCHHDYWTQKRQAKGLIRAYMERMTGLSRAQCTRLIGQYRKSGRIAVTRGRRRKFPSRYTVEDVALLARVDEAHERLSGPATRHILQREFEVYGKAEFERLAAISNGHLYNLRHSPGYRQRVLHYEKTRAAKTSTPRDSQNMKSSLQGAPSAATFRLISYWNQIARSGSSCDWKRLLTCAEQSASSRCLSKWSERALCRRRRSYLSRVWVCAKLGHVVG
jgi:hypothetical protein